MRILAMALLLVLPVSAQYYNRHNINLMVGAGLPRADLRERFSDSALVGVDYGFRFHRNLQVDAGLRYGFWRGGRE